VTKDNPGVAVAIRRLINDPRQQNYLRYGKFVVKTHHRGHPLRVMPFIHAGTSSGLMGEWRFPRPLVGSSTLPRACSLKLRIV